jgi:hypothetical protein
VLPAVTFVGLLTTVKRCFLSKFFFFQYVSHPVLGRKITFEIAKRRPTGRPRHNLKFSYEPNQTLINAHAYIFSDLTRGIPNNMNLMLELAVEFFKTWAFRSAFEGWQAVLLP